MCCFCFCFVVFVDVTFLVCFVVLLFTTEARPAALPRFSCLMALVVSARVVLNVFIDIQTSKELIQMDTDKMMTYGTFTMDDEKLTQS